MNLTISNKTSSKCGQNYAVALLQATKGFFCFVLCEYQNSNSVSWFSSDYLFSYFWSQHIEHLLRESSTVYICVIFIVVQLWKKKLFEKSAIKINIHYIFSLNIP